LNVTFTGDAGLLSGIAPTPVPVNDVVVPPPGTHVGDGEALGVGEAGGVGLGVGDGPPGHGPVKLNVSMPM
jgi:hypothetical protein